MAFCIPREQYYKVKEAFKAQNLDVSSFYKMSSVERRDYFSKLTDKDLGKFINTEFEKAVSKAEQSGQVDAIKDWVTSLLDPKLKRKGVEDDITRKIKKLEEIGALDDDNALEDLVATTMGADLTSAETKNIMKYADNIKKAAEPLGENFEKLNNPEFIDDNVKYWKAKSEMDEYLESITPASRLGVLTSTVRRGSMLFRISTQTLNILSNIINGGFVAGTKRIARLQAFGTQNKLRSQYFNMANKIFRESGYDITRMVDVNDGRKILGEEVLHSQGEGVIRKAGRFFDKSVFKLLGIADVATSAAQFQDTVGLAVKEAGKASGLKGSALDKFEKDLMLDIFKGDSITISPEADAIRQIAIADAQRSTFTETSAYSKFALGARNLIDDTTGDFKLGTQMIPFAKTPANVVGQQLENVGLGIFTGSIDVFKGILKGDKAVTQQGIEKLVRAGAGLTFSAMLVASLKPEDFMGAYDPRRSEEVSLKNSNSNAIRIGNKWVSLDYFGPFGATITGMLYAKRAKDKSNLEKLKEYAKGVGNQLMQIPGFEELHGLGETSLGLVKGEERAVKDIKKAPGNYLLSYVPGILIDTSKATDKYQRDTRDDSILESAKKRLLVSIPGLGRSVDPKLNAFGKELKTEYGEAGIWGSLSQIIFGSRVKTINASPEAEEVFRLQREGFNPRLINLEYLNGKKVTALKENLSEKQFRNVKKELGEEIEKKIGVLINKEEYKTAPDEDKNGMLDKATDKALNELYKRYIDKNYNLIGDTKSSERKQKFMSLPDEKKKDIVQKLKEKGYSREEIADVLMSK